MLDVVVEGVRTHVIAMTRKISWRFLFNVQSMHAVLRN